MNVKLEDLVKQLDFKPDDLVVDVGGYLGDFSALMKDCRIQIFEPVTEFYKICEQRFKDNPRIKVRNVAIGNRGKRELFIREYASSFFNDWTRSSRKQTVETCPLTDFVTRANVLKLNCEGAEYEILENLALQNFEQILVQFHKIPHYKEKWLKCHDLLTETHKQIFNFKWEIWKLRE